MSKRARGSVQVQLRFVPGRPGAGARGRSRPASPRGATASTSACRAAVMRDMAKRPWAATILFAGDKRGAIAGQSSFFELSALS